MVVPEGVSSSSASSGSGSGLESRRSDGRPRTVEAGARGRTRGWFRERSTIAPHASAPGAGRCTRRRSFFDFLRRGVRSGELGRFGGYAICAQLEISLRSSDGLQPGGSRSRKKRRAAARGRLRGGEENRQVLLYTRRSTGDTGPRDVRRSRDPRSVLQRRPRPLVLERGSRTTSFLGSRGQGRRLASVHHDRPLRPLPEAPHRITQRHEVRRPPSHVHPPTCTSVPGQARPRIEVARRLPALLVLRARHARIRLQLADRRRPRRHLRHGTSAPA